MTLPLKCSLKICEQDSFHLSIVLTLKSEDGILNITLIVLFTADHFNKTM